MGSDAVDGLYSAGCAAHATVRLEHGEYARGARERARWTAEDDGGSEDDALSAMARRGRGPDLYLVLACDLGRDGAWDRLCATGLAAIARALSAQGVPPAAADAAAADLPGHLIQPPRHGRSRTRLGGYRGASSLATFLAVAALSLRMSGLRTRPLASLDRSGAGGAAVVAESSAPPVPARLEDAEAAAKLEAVLPAAWARLTRQESLALLFKCRDSLPQKTIATLLGVGAPRVTRLIDSAHARLGSALASASLDGRALDGTSRAALSDVIERFLATSFPEVRPGAAPGLRSATPPENR